MAPKLFARMILTSLLSAQAVGVCELLASLLILVLRWRFASFLSPPFRLTPLEVLVGRKFAISD